MDLPNKINLLLTEAELWRLEKLRLARFTEMFAVVANCTPYISPLNNRLILIAYTQASADDLLENIVDLRFEAYTILGVESLSVSFENGILYTSSTIPAQELAECWEDGTVLGSETKLENNTPKNFTTMTSTTVAPVISTTDAEITVNKSNTLAGVQRLQNLTTLAQDAGFDVDYVVVSMVNLNSFVGWNGSYYETTDQAWMSFCDFQYDKLKRTLPSIGAVSEVAEVTNGSQPASAPTAATPTKPRKARQQRTAATKTPSRFKTFTTSNSAKGTLGKFLEAQKYSSEDRIQITEAIAALPDTANPDERETLPERIVDRLVAATRQGGKRIGREKFISAAAEMMGKNQEASAS